MIVTHAKFGDMAVTYPENAQGKSAANMVLNHSHDCCQTKHHFFEPFSQAI